MRFDKIGELAVKGEMRSIQQVIYLFSYTATLGFIYFFICIFTLFSVFILFCRHAFNVRFRCIECS